MATRNIAYGTSTAITISLASLATSATWVAGQESTSIVNTSTLAIDSLVGGTIQSGTTPTANTVIEVWVIPQIYDSTWPDVFDGTDSVETVTTRAILLNFGRLGASIAVDTNTSNRNYSFWFSVCATVGGPLPKAYVLFVTHNTGVNLNATGGNHVIHSTAVTETIA